MAISCISDVHAEKVGGKHYQILLNFLDHPKVRESDRVLLLGDVFDHLTGEHGGYIEKYHEFFQKVVELVANQKHVYFVEGNHDFHFKKTFENHIESKLGKQALAFFHYERGGLELGSGGTQWYFCHGDDLDLENKAYRRWKNIYSSRPFGFFISKILSFKMVEGIGEKASADSRKRGAASFDFESEKQKYRRAAIKFLKNKNAKSLVAGHTHIPDDYKEGELSYHNIGFPPRDGAFVFIGENGIERISL